MYKSFSFLAGAALTAIALILNIACYKALDCHDETVGGIFLDESTKSLFPLDPEKALVFKNDAGDEMRFVCKNPNIFRSDLAVELKCASLISTRPTKLSRQITSNCLIIRIPLIQKLFSFA